MNYQIHISFLWISRGGEQMEYGNTIANLGCSILKYFGLETTGNPTLKAADALLKKKYKNVVILLLDGLGLEIMKSNLAPDGFLNTHLAATYSSVFPPTTVAATTSLDSGLYPSQHGWLGWTCYYKALDKNVVVYHNTDDEGNPLEESNVAWKYYPYPRIINQLKKQGIKTYNVSPFGNVKADSFEEICYHIKDLCKTADQKYIYGYWMQPDAIMHKRGCHSSAAKASIKEMENEIEKLSLSLEDTLLIITADHGHIDSDGVVITDYPRISECLTRMPSMEPRALNLFVKEDKKEQFEAEFTKAFGDKFKLYTKEMVIKEQLLGTGKNHEHLDDLLGDYLAVAVSNLTIYNTRAEKDACIGVHAGLTKEEMEIPLIAIECINR